MAESTKLQLPGTTAPSDTFQTKNDANTLFEHHQIMSNQPRAQKAMNLMRDTFNRNAVPSTIKDPGTPQIRGTLKVPKMPKVRGVRLLTRR